MAVVANQDHRHPDWLPLLPVALGAGALVGAVLALCGVRLSRVSAG